MADKSLLRFVSCGSVDDGKSTLIGRLLYETGSLTEDQKATLVRDSAKSGHIGKDGLDFALLTDGLRAEREQGITIDVAFRYFDTERRKFIVADAPGHEEYTRNMATAASVSDAALLLVDARRGVLTQTRRHAHIAALMGISRFILAVNKMDEVGFDECRFNDIRAEFEAFLTKLSADLVQAVPVGARDGHNLTVRSKEMPWYPGPTLLEALEAIEVEDLSIGMPFRFPVQYVIRPHQDFRGYAGTVASGKVRVGDHVVVLPSARRTRIEQIVTADGDLVEAAAGDAITLTLTDHVDVGRADLIAAATDRPILSDQFAATVLWMGEEPLFHGRSYYLRLGPLLVGCQITSIKYKFDPNDLSHIATRRLELNELAFCNVMTEEPIVFDSFADNAETGRFVIIQRVTNATIGCGTIAFPLRRSQNLHWQHIDVDKATRSSLKGQRPCVLWFTGLSGSGKSTMANMLERKLASRGCHTFLLDGDNVRHGLNNDLGFTQEDRVENIRRIGECAKLFVEAGLIVITAFISPFAEERAMARRMVEEGEFLEIYINAPLEICETRDPKGLYRKARNGQLPNFTGIDSPYEPPTAPEFELRTDLEDVDTLTDRIIGFLEERKYIR